jgi:DNA-binding transcriptional regulator YiaG
MRTGIEYRVEHYAFVEAEAFVMSEIGQELKEAMALVVRQARARRQAARTHHIISANEINRARKRLGLSQEQFADVFDVSACTLYTSKMGAGPIRSHWGCKGSPESHCAGTGCGVASVG